MIKNKREEFASTVFVSYCEKDEKRLQSFFRMLEGERYELRWRENADKYAKFIEPLIESRLAICFVSRNFVYDDYCQSDLILCQNNQIPLVLLMLDNLSVSELLMSPSKRFKPAVMNIANDLKNFEEGQGLNFMTFKTTVERMLKPPKSLNSSLVNSGERVIPIEIAAAVRLGAAVSSVKSSDLFEINAKTSLPEVHNNCRFDSRSPQASKFYTRTVDIARYPVPKETVNWAQIYPFYTPTKFTSEKVKDKKHNAESKDPEVNEPDFRTIGFNAEDNRFKCERRSYHGVYKIIFNAKLNASVPRNPVGRTGLMGRGHLYRWGPNHACDSIVTRWKTYDNNKKMIDLVTRKPILQFVAIKRGDATGQWAIPGGMRDPDEVIQQTLVREFCEEALSVQPSFDKRNELLVQENITAKFKEFFSKGTLIYKGYVDDPRNTDNSWMETVVFNFHDENNQFVGSLHLKSGSDAHQVTWMDVGASANLYANHGEFLHKVAMNHNAHW